MHGDGPDSSGSHKSKTGIVKGSMWSQPIGVTPGLTYRLSVEVYQSYGWTAIVYGGSEHYIVFGEGGNDDMTAGNYLACESGKGGKHCGDGTSRDSNGVSYPKVAGTFLPSHLWGLWKAPAGVTSIQVEIQSGGVQPVQGNVLSMGLPMFQPPVVIGGKDTYANTYIPGPPGGSSRCIPHVGVPTYAP